MPGEGPGDRPRPVHGQAALERAASSQRSGLALAAGFVVLLLGYFVLFEALFAATPGKRLLGLEVQDLSGGRPPVTALVYRNLFRIEVLIPPAYLTTAVSLLVMLTNEHKQRPGDMVAHTTVRRPAPVKQPAELEGAST